MIKKTDIIQPAVPVTYIRVREIFHAFLRYQYGEFPISLPESGKLFDVFSTSLAPNPTMYRMNYSTFSQAAFDASLSLQDDAETEHQEGSIYLPTAADRSKLVPFYMPHMVYFGRSLVRTNSFFQVTSSGYRQISRIIEDEFWAKFIDFDRMFSLYCYRVGSRYSLNESLERFMIHVGMDVKLEATFSRYWRKKKELHREAFCCYNNKEHTEKLKAFFKSTDGKIKNGNA